MKSAKAIPPSTNNRREQTEFAAFTPAVLRGPNRPDLLREESLAEILSATARQFPEKPALIFGGRIVSYGELDAASNTIGNALAQRGAAPGKVIGLFLPRGADLLIAQAGITKSGAAWLPFDADTPLERIQFVCATPMPSAWSLAADGCRVCKIVAQASRLCVSRERRLKKQKRTGGTPVPLSGPSKICLRKKIP